MAKQRFAPGTTKKHLARAQRERIQRRWILIGMIITIGAAFGLVAAGIYDNRFSPVAKVNGVAISAEQFRSRMRMREAIIVRQADSIDATSEGLQDRATTGSAVLEELIKEELIRQELDRRGIAVKAADVDRLIGATFGYFPEGTPTPIPTSTPDPTVIALASITAVATEGPSPTPSPTFTPGPSPTITPTRTPFPTATLVTEEGFQTELQDTLERFNRINKVTMKDLRNYFRGIAYREKLESLFEDDVAKEQEFVQARHILVEDLATAQEVLRLLDAGRTWEELALEFSTDESNKAQGGDLGWFPRGRMIQEFEDAAFNAQVGSSVGPVETAFGWHILQVLGRENRTLNFYEFRSQVTVFFNEWLAQATLTSEIKRDPNWLARMPALPNLQKAFSGP